MSRTTEYSALILRSRQTGENREVWLLTAEAGLIRATLFGGPKSRLRSHVTPFHSGQVWVYRDPAKDFYKISDFDVHSWRPGIRELYERTMAADAIAQTILATHAGGGSWDRAKKLATETLDALENANEELCARMLIYFNWHWADFLGLKIQFEHCVSCGKYTEQRSASQHSASRTDHIWYSAKENGILCAECAAGQESTLLQLSQGCRSWLTAIESVEPSRLNLYTMDKKTQSDTKALVCLILSEALGKRLSCWDW